MKIPTTHINTKHTVMFAGALVAVVGLTPTVALAHGGDGRGGTENSHNFSDQRHGQWDGNKWHGFSWWGNWLSADKFQQWSDTILAKLDNVVSDNNLTVENGGTLRADVETKAASAKAEITALSDLVTPLDKHNLTNEQKQAIKAQREKTHEALKAYHESLKSYKTAIKAAADAAGVKLDWSWRFDKKQ